MVTNPRPYQGVKIKQITPYDAVKLIKKLNVKHANNANVKKNTLDKVDQIYHSTHGIKDCHLINEYLRICFDFSAPHKVLDIWDDIQSFHHQQTTKSNSQQKQQAFLQYSLLLKCLIKSKDNNHTEKYQQCLHWVQSRNYKLSIHHSLILKMISQCGRHQSLETLHTTHSMINDQLISLLNEEHLHQITAALITAFGDCNHVDKAMDIYSTVKHRKCSEFASEKVIKMLVDHNRNEEALRIYDEHKLKSSESLSAHLSALRASIATKDFDRANALV